MRLQIDGTDFSQFYGQDAAGTWQVCVGDSAGGDTGELVAATVNITAPVPTVNGIGLVPLLGLLVGGSLLALRRQPSIG